jgi:hypothetical protein
MEGISARDMADYELPSCDINSVGEQTEAHFLGQYLPWDSHRNANMATMSGMRYSLPTPGNWWAAENQDNAQTGLHDYFGWLKYGYGRGCAQISVDVRSGKIGREEALAWVEQHDGLFPEVYAGVPMGAVLDRIGMTRQELDQQIEIWRSPSA